ncbi:hypothetical protein DPMN_169493 [Dreissena polymorpha]|uniref:Uncharacterized protein n=1 Tax=Dreissena polymorpha TaxID=45954 RepID=A0A9D4DWN3_DREPO|nr:hypothetical protein DPMN_169493 [Dreissena polymorpha]
MTIMSHFRTKNVLGIHYRQKGWGKFEEEGGGWNLIITSTRKKKLHRGNLTGR